MVLLVSQLKPKRIVFPLFVTFNSVWLAQVLHVMLRKRFSDSWSSEGWLQLKWFNWWVIWNLRTIFYPCLSLITQLHTLILVWIAQVLMLSKRFSNSWSSDRWFQLKWSYWSVIWNLKVFFYFLLHYSSRHFMWSQISTENTNLMIRISEYLTYLT